MDFFDKAPVSMSSREQSSADTASPRPAKRARYLLSEGLELSGKTIIIRVVSKNRKRDMSIHENLLCRDSAYFQNISKGGWTESDGIVELSGFSFETIEIYTSFLYTGRMCTKKHDDVKTKNPAGVAESLELTRLKRLYQFADYIQSPDLKDAVVDASMEISNSSGAYWLDFVQIIYDASQKDSVHRKLAIDYVMCEAAEEMLLELVRDAEGDLGVDIRTSVVKARFSGDAISTYFEYDNNPCSCHEHTALGKTCYKERYGHK